MKYKRTIVETLVWTEVIEADSPEAAWSKTIYVKTEVRNYDNRWTKSACVGKIEKVEP